jgi:hypothetical protein
MATGSLPSLKTTPGPATPYMAASRHGRQPAAACSASSAGPRPRQVRLIDPREERVTLPSVPHRAEAAPARHVLLPDPRDPRTMPAGFLRQPSMKSWTPPSRPCHTGTGMTQIRCLYLKRVWTAWRESPNLSRPAPVTVVVNWYLGHSRSVTASNEGRPSIGASPGGSLAIADLDLSHARRGFLPLDA